MLTYLSFHLMLFYDVQVYSYAVFVCIKSKYINEKSLKHFIFQNSELNKPLRILYAA